MRTQRTPALAYAIDNDDDADNRTDVDWDHLDENWNEAQIEQTMTEYPTRIMIPTRITLSQSLSADVPSR